MLPTRDTILSEGCALHAMAHVFTGRTQIHTSHFSDFLCTLMCLMSLESPNILASDMISTDR